MRLNLGAGGSPLAGYENLDRKSGQEVYPLSVAAGSVDEIRASHVLEHFGHGLVPHVLADWFAALKPGGLIKLAVPDFQWIAENYLAGIQIPVQGYVMGGQVDKDDVHGAIFDRETLMDAMRAAGFVGITAWKSDARDCSALPVSLNIQGIKPPAEWPKVRAVMSTPRLGWNDFWGCALEHLSALRIPMTKHTGAFWEQTLTRALDECLTENPEYILFLDYDTIFDRWDLESLLSAAMRNPQADAIAALQVHRQRSTPLMTVQGADGKATGAVTWDTFEPELTQALTAHFGCTLVRADKIREIPRPWFHGQPAGGEWDDNRTDPDIYFWRKWASTGNSLFIANRVPVGHLEVMIRWPDRRMSATYQHPQEYHSGGKPEDVWR